MAQSARDTPPTDVRSRLPSSEVRRAQVMAMAATGTSPKEIAQFFQISVGELKRGYSEELKRGLVWMKGRIEIRMAEKALAGDSRCMLAWLHQYGGWTEVTRKEITGPNGEPLSIRNFDANSLDQIVKALREADAGERRSGRDRAPTIDIGPNGVRDLESISGPPDEGAE